MVTVLIVSKKSLDGIRLNAAKNQDNVLVEYELALLKNQVDHVPVVPIFVPNVIKDENGHASYEPFNPQENAQGFPDLPHARGQFAKQTLSSIKDPLPDQFSSVSKTISEIFKLQGYTLDTTDRASIQAVGKLLLQDVLEKNYEPTKRSSSPKREQVITESPTPPENSPTIPRALQNKLTALVSPNPNQRFRFKQSESKLAGSEPITQDPNNGVGLSPRGRASSPPPRSPVTDPNAPGGQYSRLMMRRRSSSASPPKNRPLKDEREKIKPDLKRQSGLNYNDIETVVSKR